MIAAYRWTHSPSHAAWSEGRQPLVRCAAFIKWTEWTLAMTFSGYDDSTINIVLGLLLLLLLYTWCVCGWQHTVVLYQQASDVPMQSESVLDLDRHWSLAAHQHRQYCQFSHTCYTTLRERPYVYKPSSIQTRWHELFHPASMDAFELEYDFVHVRAFTYILSWVLAKWYLQF